MSRPTNAPTIFGPKRRVKQAKAQIAIPVGEDGSIELASAYAAQVEEVIRAGIVFKEMRYQAETGHRRVAVLDDDGNPTGETTSILLSNREHQAAIKMMAELALKPTVLRVDPDDEPAGATGVNGLDMVLAGEGTGD